MQPYDLIIIGSGSAGFAAATAAREHGIEKVLMVEKRRVGYSLCTNEGCMPSKTLLASAELKAAIHRSDELGIEVRQLQANWPVVQRRVRDLVENDFFAARREAIQSAKIEVVSGSASFVSPHEVKVDDELYSADKIIIATGSNHFIPSIRGLDETGYITSDQALYLEKLPDSLLIIGGGFIAIELGYLFHQMGVKVTILQRSERILSRLDADIGRELQRILHRGGIEILTDVAVQEVRKAARQKVAIIGRQSGEEESLFASELLMATGRRPAIDGLNLENAGVWVADQGAIEVNESLQTNVPHIYAIGDVNDQVALVYAATMEGRVAGFNVANRASPQKMNYDLVAKVIFSHPEIGSVGLTEEDAKGRGLDVVVDKTPMSDIGKAVAIGQTEGFIKMIAERPSGRILGVHILGPQATDIVQVAIPHFYHRDTVFDVLNIPYPHPTLGEALSYSAEAIVDKLKTCR